MLTVAHAQTRVLVGPSGGLVYDNAFFGVTTGLEVPVGHRFEADLYDTAAGEKHTALGGGWTNSLETQGIVWTTEHLGLNAGVQQSRYSVTGTAKSEYFVNGGLVIRNNSWVPTRFTLDYVREVANGLMPNGDETNRLQGGIFTWDSILDCGRHYCIRFQTTVQAGRVLSEGNPRCDGTLGNTGGPNGGPCPRQAQMGGGASASVLFQFPRHAEQENELF
jgi:hypothetical protein